MPFSAALRQRLRCPRTHAPLEWGQDLKSASEPSCVYPIIDGVPILIDEKRSLFTLDEFKRKADTTFGQNPSRLRKILRAMWPTISRNSVAKGNYRQLSKLLPSGSVILVVGGSVRGQGMEPIFERRDIEVISTDVTFGPQTDLICDAHDLPFEDKSVDAVVIQAVLEHVLDPWRCVEEAYRVLRADGVVYAETPFMQQVHMQQFDFTRFTHLGHRRLFRRFTELSSGPTAGPGSAMAWTWTYLLRSMASSRRLASLFIAVGCLTSFWLKYLDVFLLNTPGSYDAASGFYFLGRRSDTMITDREIVQAFRGLR